MDVDRRLVLQVSGIAVVGGVVAACSSGGSTAASSATAGGGEVLSTGTPEQLAHVVGSATGFFLKETLEGSRA